MSWRGWLWSRLPLGGSQRALLRALAEGHVLKVHRTVDGAKVYRLHRLDGQTEIVPGGVVRGLERRGLIESNMKFPAATFMLTERGKAWAAPGDRDRPGPVGPRGFRR